MEQEYTLKIIAGLSKRNSDLTIENQKLKAYIKELEGALYQ